MSFQDIRGKEKTLKASKKKFKRFNRKDHESEWLQTYQQLRGRNVFKTQRK